MGTCFYVHCKRNTKINLCFLLSDAKNQNVSNIYTSRYTILQSIKIEIFSGTLKDSRKT
jgi:hypothetical protein